MADIASGPEVGHSIDLVVGHSRHRTGREEVRSYQGKSAMEFRGTQEKKIKPMEMHCSTYACGGYWG